MNTNFNKVQCISAEDIANSLNVIIAPFFL
jgi:hypothetical protein